MRTKVVVIGLVLLVGGCTDDGGEDQAGATTEAPTTESPTTEAPTTATTAAPTTTATTSPEATVPPFPAALTTLEHGGEVAAVVLAGSTDFDDPSLAAAVAAAEEAGYQTGPTDCDAGAAEALGFTPADQVYTVSVYFASDDDAQAAVTAFEARNVAAVATTVRTFCLD